MNKLIIAILLFSISNVFAQVKRDQDLITLKNGTQLLGYIIEQKPGKTIKIFRPSVNDTVMVRMDEIEKLSKILIQSFSEKKIEDSDTIIETGRYNNKNNVYQFSFIANYCDNYGDNFVKGFSIAWYKNFNNRFYAGVSTNIFINQRNEKTIYDLSSKSAITVDKNINQYQLMLESKLRLSRKHQNKRLTTLLGFNSGYIFDRSYTDYPNLSSSTKYRVKHEQNKGNFVLQTSLSFKVNPDNNSGFIIEPGYAFYTSTVNQFSQNTSDGYTSGAGLYLGYRKDYNHIFTFRLSYFF